MDEQSLEERALVSLRIEVEPFPAEARPVTFTMVDDTGEALSAPVELRDGELENLHDVLARIAARTTPAEGGLSFGGQDTRVILGFDGYTAPHYRFYCTFAFPSGDGGYTPVTARAQVTDASLARLVDGVGQVKDAGQGAVDWVVAD